MNLATKRKASTSQAAPRTRAARTTKTKSSHASSALMDALNEVRKHDEELEWFTHFNENLKAPNAFLIALEARAPWELGATIATWPLLKQAPEGDGHPVIVFPGLGAGDMTTAPMRNFLDALGYETHGWDLGRNLGPREGVIERSLENVAEIYAKTRRKVTLIGWSLGGVYAREFAKALPDKVRAVITLGTPFAGDPRATNAYWFYRLASGHHAHETGVIEQIRHTPPVPTTSIYSRTDGVVTWQLSHLQETARAENIEVIASHVGLGLNPAALYAIADRLAQPEKAWQKFDRSGWKQYFYRDTTRDDLWSAATKKTK
jgi:pimeloyl-ACP methyl ester carboxylesterase